MNDYIDEKKRFNLYYIFLEDKQNRVLCEEKRLQLAESIFAKIKKSDFAQK